MRRPTFASACENLQPVAVSNVGRKTHDGEPSFSFWWHAPSERWEQPRQAVLRNFPHLLYSLTLMRYLKVD